MAVRRRFYEEIIDVPSLESQTTPPSSLFPKEELSIKSKEPTDVPSKHGDYGEEGVAYDAKYPVISSREVIGRTWPDLAFAFFSRPQFVPTALTLLAFLISIGQLHKLSDAWRPVLITVVLNAVWFGGKAISSLAKRDRGVEEKTRNPRNDSQAS